KSLLTGWMSDGTCKVERSKDWIKWRFDPSSQNAYEWATAYRNGNAEAWAVRSTCDWEGASLVDLLGSDSVALEAVTSAVLRQAKQKGVASLRVVTNEPHA